MGSHGWNGRGRQKSLPHKLVIERGTGWRKDLGNDAGRLPAEASVDAEMVGDAPIVVRSFEPGDRMEPWGMAGSRKLQDIFTDQKIPRAQRSSIPVVVCRGEIIWIPGYRIARSWAVKSRNDAAVHLKNKFDRINFFGVHRREFMVCFGFLQRMFE